MNDHFKPLDNGEVLSISESALIYIGHTTFRVGEFSEAVRSQLEQNTQGWNEGKNSWFTDAGVDCEVLRFTSGGWQKGKVRLRLEFSPDDGSSSGTQGAAAQPVAGGMEMPSAIPDTVAPPTYAQGTEGAGDSSNFMKAAMPIAAVVGTAAVGTAVVANIFNQGEAVAAEVAIEESLLDESFDLEAASPESEIAGLDDEDFELDPPQDDFANPEASALGDVDGDMDFGADDFSDQPEASLLDENLDNALDSEFADADLSSLGDEDFSLESSPADNEVDLSGLEDTDFALEDPLGDALEDQASNSLENDDFALGTTEADLSDLGEDNFSLDTMGEEAADRTDLGLENSFTEFTSLEEEDSGLGYSPEMALGDLENTDLSGFGDEELALETPISGQDMGGMEEFTASSTSYEGDANDEFISSENADFGLDDLDADFSGLENADFGSGEVEGSSSFENLESSGLEDEFGLETPEFSAATSDTMEDQDFGLDDLMGDDAGSDDLEFLSISDQDKQQFEQATAEVSQAFDEDFGLELESNNGLDSLDFDLAGDDAMDAIDQQLSSALDDDLDLLGDADGLTENMFADQDDALFKDVWGDINKTQVK